MRKPSLFKNRGKWYARFWDCSNGKYYSKCLNIPVEGKKERRAEAIEAAWKMAENPKAKSIGDLLLLEYIGDFWKDNSEYVRYKALVDKQPLSKHYVLTNRQLFKNKIKTYKPFANLKIKDLSKTHIKNFMMYLAENGCSGRMINGTIAAIRVPIKRAWEDDKISNFPLAGMRQARHIEKTRGILTPVEIKEITDKPTNNPRSRLAVLLPIFCSMRMGEVRGLLWGDIGDGIIKIQHNWQEGEGLKQCKAGSDGIVPMPNIIAELLNRLFKEAPCTGQNDFVMSTKPKHPISREFLRAALKSELSAIGITETERLRRNIVYHSMRHTFVTVGRIVAKLTDAEVMALARHKDKKMMDRYTHAQEAMDYRGLKAQIENAIGV
jgi:integrase